MNGWMQLAKMHADGVVRSAQKDFRTQGGTTFLRSWILLWVLLAHCPSVSNTRTGKRRKKDRSVQAQTLLAIWFNKSFGLLPTTVMNVAAEALACNEQVVDVQALLSPTFSRHIFETKKTRTALGERKSFHDNGCNAHIHCLFG